MEIRAIRYFVATAEEGSVTAAARRVLVSQPAISRQIAALERELEVALFERGGGALQLTHAGRRFLVAARDLIRRADAVRAAVGKKDPRELRLRGIAPETTITQLLVPLIAEYGHRFATIDAEAAPPARVYEVVLEAGADFGVTTFVPPIGWAAKLLGHLRVTAHVPAGHPLYECTSVEVTELESQPLICVDRSHTARLGLDAALVRAGVRPTRFVEMRSATLAQASAAAGRGVAILSGQAIRGLRAIPITVKREEVQLPIYAGWDPSHYTVDHIENLVETFAENFDAILDRAWGPPHTCHNQSA